jgi:hypothetical protein
MLPAPATRIVRRSSNEFYASQADRIVVKHHLGRTKRTATLADGQSLAVIQVELELCRSGDVG